MGASLASEISHGMIRVLKNFRSPHASRTRYLMLTSSVPTPLYHFTRKFFATPGFSVEPVCVTTSILATILADPRTKHKDFSPQKFDITLVLLVPCATQQADN